MPLLSGIDIIVGMDFMEANDVVLLTKHKKVLFGSHVLNFLVTDDGGHILNYSNPGCKYGPQDDVQPSNVLKNSLKPALKDVSNNMSVTATEEGVSEDCMQQHEDSPSIPNDASNIENKPKPTEKNSKDSSMDLSYLYTDIHTDLCVALSAPDLSENEKWKIYNKIMLQSPHLTEGEKKQFENESTWADESPDSNSTEAEQTVFICQVKCSQLGDDQDGRRGKTLSRLRKRLVELNAIAVVNENEKIAEAWNIEKNPIDPVPENKEAWLENAYPKDENGDSIRPQIDQTIPSEVQFVNDLKSGKVCKLAAQAFQSQTKFNPPPWAERLTLHTKPYTGPAKKGIRIRCPVHLRDELKKFHEDLYFRLFIEPATDCESCASVLIIRKPDKTDGTPRGYRFVVDLRSRNETVRDIGNQLPEAATLFEYLRDAKVVSVYDVKDGYWNCPLDPASRDLVAFQSECGCWRWLCLPQGLCCSSQYFSAWLMRVYRKYSIVIGQTKILPVIKEKNTEIVNNMITVATKLKQLCNSTNNENSSCVQMQIEDAVVMSPCAPAQCNLITSSQDLLTLNSGVKIPNVKLVQEGKFKVLSSSKTDVTLYADAPAFAAMSAAMPITGPIEDWFAKILHGCELLSFSSAAEEPEITYTKYMNGGIDEKILCEQDRFSLKPKDLGTWQSDPFASFYVDDAFCRSVTGVQEGRLQAIVFLRISAVERIPLNEKCNILCKYVRFLGMINGNG